MSRHLLPFTVLATVACIAAAEAHAQTIQGMLVSQATGEPVVGAEVALIDTLGQQISAVRSDSAGMFRIGVTPGTFASSSRIQPSCSAGVPAFGAWKMWIRGRKR